jgi:hypothetical protein
MRRNNRPYVHVGRGVLVDLELFDLLRAEGRQPVFDKKRDPEYPMIVDEQGRTVDALHRRLAIFLFGVEKVNDSRYVVHHRDENKRNCRRENIELRLRPDHLKIHRLRVRRRGETYEVESLWRPHEKEKLTTLDPDARLREREDGKTSREIYSPPSMFKIEPIRLSMKQKILLAEDALEDAFERLDEETRHLDSGAPIPKTNTVGSYNDQASREAGVKPERLGCHYSEAALVRALVKHQRHDGTFEVGAVAAELGTELAVLTRIMERPSVWLAIERWRIRQRLPKPCKPGWPGTRPK